MSTTLTTEVMAFAVVFFSYILIGTTIGILSKEEKYISAWSLFWPLIAIIKTTEMVINIIKQK